MPKINQEEYEILKSLDEKWKWIARDKDRGLYAFTEKPVRKYVPSPYWDTETEGPYTALELFDEIHLFQFIQWEDDEPYNIAELIEEYESEETEVKDIEWLKNEVNELPLRFLGFSVLKQREEFAVNKDDVLELINQLDEPEVLSQEWIDEHRTMGLYKDSSGRLMSYFALEDLQNLLVPKQEKVEVPRFVADILEENTFADLPTAFEELFSANAGHYYGEDVCKWIVSNEEAFARAWLDGYTVEEEQKYQVIIRDGEYMRLYLCKYDDNVTIGTNDNYIEKCPEVTYLTEQEIKDYDERYWPFAVKVKELEE